MKKLTCILLSLIFLTSILSACTDGGSESSAVSGQTSEQSSEASQNESSEIVSDDVTSDVSDETSDDMSDDKEIVLPPRENRMLLGSSNDENLIGYRWEVSRVGNSVFSDPSLADSVFEHSFGFEGKLTYFRSYRPDELDYVVHTYKGEGIEISINPENNEIVRLDSSQAERTKEIDDGDAREIVVSFIKQYYQKEFDFTVDYSDKAYFYEFHCEKDGVVNAVIGVKTDNCGNILLVVLREFPYILEKMPKLSDEEYMAKGIETIKLFYDAIGIDAELEATAVNTSGVGYYAHLDMYYIVVHLRYTVTYPDGSINETDTILYLPYADSSDVKR